MNKKIVLFLGLTFGLSWLMAGILKIFVGDLNTTAGFIITVLYMFVPMTMAVVVQKFIYKERVKVPLGISFKINRWFFVAWLLPFVMAFAAFGVGLLFPGVEYTKDMAGMFEKFKNTLSAEQLQMMKDQYAASPIHPIWIGVIQALIAGVTINAVAGFGEELGWRGFLQKEFEYMGFWWSSILIGFIWGIWHAPIILMGHNYPQHPVAGVFMMTLGGILLAPIFSYLRVKSKSVISAAIIHGTFNASAGLAVILIKGGDDLTVGMFGLSGFIVLAILNVMIYIFDRYITRETVKKIPVSIS